MQRLVLAVVLAGALVGASAPALEDARTTAADRRVRGDLLALRNAAQELARTNDPAPSGADGARRVVTVTLPSKATAASVAAVEIGAEGGTALSYALAGRPTRTIGIEGLTVRATTDAGADRDAPSPLVLRERGTHRLVLELVSLDGEPAVVVRPLDTDV